MFFDGIIIAVATFLIIGVFHPIVIKSEYYWGVKCWPVFAVAGVALLLISLFISNILIAAIVGVTGGIRRLLVFVIYRTHFRCSLRMSEPDTLGIGQLSL